MRPVLDLNIDMIGRNAPEQILITPTKEHDAYNFLTRLAEKHAASEGFTDLGSADAYWSRSDHAMFYEHLEQMLLDVKFLNPDQPKRLMMRLRRLFNRARPDQNEMNILRGILAASQRAADRES